MSFSLARSRPTQLTQEVIRVNTEVQAIADATTQRLVTRTGSVSQLMLVVTAESVQIRPGDYTSRVFDGDATGNPAGENVIITAVDHGRLTGDGPFRLTELGTLPSGLAEGVDYYVRSLDTDVLALYLTEADAIADTNRVALVDDGTGPNGFAGFSIPADQTSGYNAVVLPVGIYVIDMPDRLTLMGLGTSPAATYWMVP